MDKFIGINIRRDMPVDKMQAVGFVREYHRAALDQGFPGLNSTQETASPVYPLSQYKFNPSYQTQAAIPFDTYYKDLTDSGLEIGVSLLQSFPWMYDSDSQPLTPQLPEINDILEQKPMYPGNDPLDPNSYLAHADWMYQYAARYGNTVQSEAVTNQIISPRLHPSEVPLTGLGYINYFEDWNEPDKWWIPQLPSTYFSPAEYAVMLSADYDGHQETMGLVPDPDNPGQMRSVVGIKNADPTAQVVTTGLSDLDLPYIQEMVEWFEENRDPTGPNGLYPFEVISFHHYSNNGQGLNQLGEYGISPEEDLIKQKMQPIAAYRDQNFPNVELWLSEFGYDIDPLSQQRVPWEGIGNADRQEIQAQWILRSYLETVAAGFDRAMLYELQDACEGELCGLFQVSGLTKRDYSPRKSWYYVYTMKNVLAGYVYDGELSPCQSFDCATDCPRVYRFINPNNANDKVFALWSPTSCDKPAYTYNLDLEGANTASLISLEAPSTVGIKTALTGASVPVSISERPVFVKVGEAENSAQVPCVNNLEQIESTCSTASITWESTSGQDNADIWVFPTGTTDFNILNGQFFAENVPVEQGAFVLTGLDANTSYEVVLFLRDAAGNISEPCSITINTENSTCQIPLSESWVYDFSGTTTASVALFDEQNNHDPICNAGGEPQNSFGFAPNNSNDLSVSIDLQDYYRIDAFYLYDAQDYGNFKIEYAQSPDGPWQVAADYLSLEFATWVTLDNLIPAYFPVKYLRFTSDKNDRAIIGEVILCGELVDFDDSNLPPAPPFNFTYTGSSCNSLRFAWTAPQDDDIIGYQFSYNGQSTTAPVGESFEIFGLQTETSYDVSVQTLDADGNLSTSVSLSAATLTNAECTDSCNATCDCQICLHPAWIQNLSPAAGIDPGRLIDEQNTSPACGSGAVANTEWGENYVPGSGVPPIIAVIDLQQCYDLSAVHIFDGSGVDVLKIEYRTQSGDWQLLENYLTAANYTWHSFDNLNITARYLRFTKETNQAKVNEIALCGTATNCDDTNCTIAAGTPCNDGDDCTTDDVYDDNCNCAGTFVDTDNDNVCDAEDLCPGADDNQDNDEDGIPNACDDTPNGNGDDCDYLVVETNITDETCPGAADGLIELILPDCPNGGGATNVNLALNGTATQSSTNYSAEAARAIDNNTDGNFWGAQSCSATAWQIQPWWQLDLGEIADIEQIRIWNRSDCCQNDLAGYYVLISETPFTTDNLSDLLAQDNVVAYHETTAAAFPTMLSPNVAGRYVRVQKQGAGFLIIAEMETIGTTTESNTDCNFSINWSDGNTAESRTELMAGAYMVTVEDDNDCAVTLNLSVDNTEADSDNDGVCDSDDICPGYDDTADNDDDGTPNGCDSTPNGEPNGSGCSDFSIEYTVENASCDDASDGSIVLNLPCDSGGNTNENDENIAVGASASQSSTNWNAEANRAIDGNTEGDFWAAQSVTGTMWSNQPWWEIDLGASRDISQIKIYNRTDCCAYFLSDFYVLFSESPFGTNSLSDLLDNENITAVFQAETAGSPSLISQNINTRYVRVQLQGAGILSLAEVEIISANNSENCDYSIAWNNNSTEEIQTNLAPATYTVSVTDNVENCTEIASITVASANGSCSDLSITCPPDQAIELPAGTQSTILTWNSPTGITSCPDGNAIAFLQTTGLASGSEFFVGTDMVITYTASDNCNNSTDCSFNIRVDGETTGGGPAPDNYCESQATAPWLEWIERVQFADIDNQSSKNGYGDYTDIETTVQQNGTYTLTLTPGYSWTVYDEYWRVWIDYNRDGDFDDIGEMVLEQNGTGAVSQQISIPASISFGKTRMRVAMQRGAFIDACGTYERGETEDYTIDLLPSTMGFVQQEFLTFEAMKEQRSIRLHWATNTTEQTDRFVVEQAYGGADFSEIHTRIINEEEHTATFDYYDNAPQLGKYLFRLRQEMSNGAVRYSDIKEVQFALDINAIDVFPNPTSRELFVALKPYRGLNVKVQLLNQYGQVKQEKAYKNLEDDFLKMDVSRYSAGLYFVRVKAENLRPVSCRVMVLR